MRGGEPQTREKSRFIGVFSGSRNFSLAREQLRSIVHAAHIACLEPSANRTIFARAYTLR
jgi:hypothetical protein